jgi:hypothetical protein
MKKARPASWQVLQAMVDTLRCVAWVMFIGPKPPATKFGLWQALQSLLVNDGIWLAGAAFGLSWLL